jgi:hypothetical protein
MAIRSERAADAPEQHPNLSGRSQTIRTNARRKGRFGRSLRAAALAGVAGSVLAGASGCTLLTNALKQIQRHECLDEFMIAHRNRVFAAKAWYREQHCHKDRPFLDEFKAGFLQGYMDIAEGGNGCLPCVAPDQYWGWRYQSPDGQAAINAWFAGYPLGVKAAEQDGVGYWGHTHYGEHSVATTSKPKEPQAEAPEKPQPTGPDGLPLMEETIVPGSARFVPDGQPVEAYELERAIESLEAPEPAAEPKPVPAPMPASTDEAAIDLPAEVLPAQTTRQPEPTSKPTTYSLGDLGGDSIEDVFGFSEAADSATPADNDATSAATLPASEPALESANADEDIPFQFE